MEKANASENTSSYFLHFILMVYSRLFKLLRLALGEKPVEAFFDEFSAMSAEEWRDLYKQAGKQTVFKFYEQAYEHMHEGSYIYVVLQRKQGAPSTEKKLMELFGNVTSVDISAGYRVMRSIK